MIKRYCDVCGKEITLPYFYNRVIRQLRKLEVTLDASYGNDPRPSDICRECVIEAVNKGADVANG